MVNRERASGLDGEGMAYGLVLADLATWVILGLQSGAPADALHELLAGEPPHWAEVHQATGIVSVQLGWVWMRRLCGCAGTRSPRGARCGRSPARWLRTGCGWSPQHDWRARWRWGIMRPTAWPRRGIFVMSREHRIVETFVELADTMVDEFDVIEFLHRLAERCAELLDCAESGLLWPMPAGFCG